MMPSPNTAMRVRAPPLNRLRNPSTPDDFDAASSWATFEKFDEGDRHVRPELVQGDDGQREEDLLAKVGDPEDVGQAGKHGTPRRRVLDDASGW